MRLRTATLVVLVFAATAMALSGASAAATGDLTVDQLVYRGAQIKTQVDMNGVAAAALIGQALDTVAAQLEEQAKAAKASGEAPPGPAGMLPMIAPMIGPAKDAIKSLDRVTVLVMNPKEQANPDQFVTHYNQLMAPRGWSPLITVKDQDGTAVVTMLAPEAKGMFFAVSSPGKGKGREVVVGLITTTKPLGDLIGQIAAASGGAIPSIMSSMGRPNKPAPPAETSEKQDAK